jgi:lysophospholipase L1-like esterase
MLLLLIGMLTNAAPAAVTILPLGDSITAGTSAGTYRHHLHELLQAAGLDYRFVGPHRDGKGLSHAGFGGWNSTRIRGVAERIYREHPADIVLLHAGHNHFADATPIPVILKDTRAIIESIAAINPRVRILLAQVIPAGKLPKYAYLPELNRQLVGLADALRREGHVIELVDQDDGFRWETDTTADRVHPNAVGAAKMASRWFTAIRPAIAARHGK